MCVYVCVCTHSCLRVKLVLISRFVLSLVCDVLLCCRSFRTFERDTMPIVNLFASEGKVRTVSSTASREEVYDAVRQVLHAELEARREIGQALRATPKP